MRFSTARSLDDPGPTLVVSDVHLSGCWRRQIEYLRGLWRPGERVVLNGDTLNRSLDKRPEVRREVLESLFERARRDGAELTLVAGNCDPYCSDLDDLLLAGGRIWVTHGHVLFDDMSPWANYAHRTRRHIMDYLDRFPPEYRDRLEHRYEAMRWVIRRYHDRPETVSRSQTVQGMFRLWRAIVHLPRLPATLRAWRDLPRLADRAARQRAPQARVVLLGHTHRRGCWQAGGRWVVNTGSLETRQSAWAVRINPPTLSLHRIRRQGSRCRLSGPVRRIDLDPHQPASSP